MINIQKLERVGIFLIGLALLIVLAYWVFSTLPQAQGGSPPGTSPASTSLLTYYNGDVSASGTVGIMYEAKRDCNSRIISTASSSIKIGMSSTTPSALSGVLQLASTTVAYDSSIYGCGMWRVYGYSVPGTAITNHTIHILEF